MEPRLIEQFNVRLGGSLVILRGFRRGFLGQGPKRESHLELLGRQLPSRCLSAPAPVPLTLNYGHQRNLRECQC